MQSRLKSPKGTATSEHQPAKRTGIPYGPQRNGTSRPKDIRWHERHVGRSHARHSAFVVGRDIRTTTGADSLKIGRDAQAIIDRVKAFGRDQLGDRYHELVDKRLQGTLDFTELLELERIEARLDAEDQDEAARLTILQEDWRRERNQLVASIEHLLARFKAAS